MKSLACIVSDAFAARASCWVHREEFVEMTGFPCTACKMGVGSWVVRSGRRDLEGTDRGGCVYDFE